jgi:hypothetical protein
MLAQQVLVAVMVSHQEQVLQERLIEAVVVVVVIMVVQAVQDL